MGECNGVYHRAQTTESIFALTCTHPAQTHHLVFMQGVGEMGGSQPTPWKMPGSTLGRSRAEGSRVNERQRLLLAAGEEVHGASVSVPQPALEPRGDPAGSRGRLIYTVISISLALSFLCLRSTSLGLCMCKARTLALGNSVPRGCTAKAGQHHLKLLP